jgi:iron(III) transport system ATP-binding protein
MSIKIDNLTKSFAGVAAVSNLSLTVPDGEMLVLLGPSGCGKTTTMRCIAGLERPDAGAIAIAGRTVFEAGKLNVPINTRNVGMVFQSYAIWPHMSVFDNVAFPLRVKNLPRAEIAARTNDMLAQVGLADLAARGASTLSGGQMQRVALARSLVMQPAALLFDEPLSNLDARLRDRLRIQLRELQTKFRITSVYVTHDQHEALALADRIAVMHRGALLQVGDPVSIYSQPASSTVADFIGYSNIFRVGARKPVDGGVEIAFEGSRTILCAAAPARDADELYACIRPEDIAIAVDVGESAAAPDGNVLRGEVLLASFMGSFMQYRVRADTGDVFEVFSSVISGAIKLGARVRLQFAPKSIHLLPSL